MALAAAVGGSASAIGSGDIVGAACCLVPDASEHPIAAAGTMGFVPAGTPWLLDTTGFPRRWNCGIWSQPLGWLHIGSDIAIWAAYMAIPIVLGFFLWKRRTPLPLVTWLFIAFIASCGFGHLLEAVIFWHPVYRLAGVWKLVTAIVSCLTVVALIPIVPKVLSWPTLREVDEQLQQEMVERKSTEERMLHIVNAAPVGMLMIDEHGAITLANREIERMFGYEQGDLVGKQVETIVPSEFGAGSSEERHAFFEGPSMRRMGSGRELSGLMKDGGEVLVDIGLSPLPEAGGAGVLASVVDVTERRRTEAELKRLNETLESKNRELEQFVYTASHDLKSPLLTVQGFTGWLQQDLAEGRHDRLDKFAGRILEGTSRMQANIDDLLELSRVGSAVQAFETIELAPLVERILTQMDTQIAEAGAIVTVADTMPTVTCDPGRIRQVLENLLANAIKYGLPERGAFEILIGAEIVGDEVRLHVADRGPGVPPEYHKKIFCLFQRLKTEVDGTGIGLAIVRRVAEVHDGRAWVEETPGGGATFVFAIPTEPVGHSHGHAA